MTRNVRVVLAAGARISPRATTGCFDEHNLHGHVRDVQGPCQPQRPVFSDRTARGRTAYKKISGFPIGKPESDISGVLLQHRLLRGESECVDNGTLRASPSAGHARASRVRTQTGLRTFEPVSLASGNSAEKRFGGAETGRAFLATPADSGRQRQREPSSPRAKPRKVKDYSGAARKLTLRRTAWWAFLDTHRTLCIAPSPEIREIFEQLKGEDFESAD
jgi:hypothetical protein